MNKGTNRECRAPTPAAHGGASSTNPVLEVEGLSKRYREGDEDHVILSGVTVTLRAGEFVALLGPSGSGKSTLLNLVSGIDTPDAGSVRVGGASLTTVSERERTLLRRRHIGFVFQFFNLIPTLTVEENLLLPLELNGGDPAVHREDARRLLERVGLAKRADAFPDRLSGGERQRVAVARALVHSPALVLADEPTGNLDASSGARVLELLRELSTDRRAAALVVTHSEEVARSADRVLEIHDCRLMEPSLG